MHDGLLLNKRRFRSFTHDIREKQQWINIKFTSNNERIENITNNLDLPRRSLDRIKRSQAPND